MSTCNLAFWKIYQRVILICIAISTSVAFGHASNHKKMFNDRLVVEHLELISPLRGAQYAKGFFTIWNGTTRSVYLERITDPNGKKLRLQSLTNKANRQQWRDVALPKVIPPKSEFTIRSEHFQMLIDANSIPTNDGEEVPIFFHFEDRKPVQKSASILPFGSQPTDHHHGLVDNDQ